MGESDEQSIQARLKDVQEKKGNQGSYSFKLLRMTKDKLDDCEDGYYKREVAFYEPDTFYNLGRNICISILDVWNKNPYTRVTNANEQRK